jgi:hypothetical protein
VRAQNENLRTKHPRGIPTHARILGQAEEIPGGLGQKHLRRKRQKPGWSRSVCGDRRKLEVGSFEYGAESDFRDGWGS